MCLKIATTKKCPKQSVRNFFDNPFDNLLRTFFETVRPKIRPSKKSVCPSVKKSVRHKKGPAVGGYPQGLRPLGFLALELSRNNIHQDTLGFSHNVSICFFLFLQPCYPLSISPARAKLSGNSQSTSVIRAPAGHLSRHAGCSLMSAVCHVQCAVWWVQYTGCGVKCVVYRVECALCSVWFAVCSVQFAVCSVQCLMTVPAVD